MRVVHKVGCYAFSWSQELFPLLLLLLFSIIVKHMVYKLKRTLNLTEHIE